MDLSDFLLEVLETLNCYNVEYLVVGGHAVNYHGYLRATLDMDIWINKTDENLVKLFNALLQLGYEEENCKGAIKNFVNNHIIKIPKRNDIIDMLDSYIIKADFDKAYQKRESALIDDIEMKVIGFDDLINCKLKTNRDKDLIDVQELKKINELLHKKKKKR